MLSVLAALCLAGAPPRTATAGMFPQRFSVTTGTTILVNDGWDSTTQTGEVYYDGEEQWLRMDHRSGGKDVTFVARFKEGKLFLLVDDRCINIAVNGTLMPFATPRGSVLNEERALVRDTFVVNYNGVMRGINGKLHSMDFFVKKENRSLGDAGNWIPWRTTYSRLYRREIGMSSDRSMNDDDEEDNRDWIFYGEDDVDPADEELEHYVRPSQAVATFEPGNKVITDYYNFSPLPPPKHLFDRPSLCRETADDDENDGKFSFTAHAGWGGGHQIFEFQKTLSDLTAEYPHLHHYQRLLEDACIRYFCDASEKDASKESALPFNVLSAG
ncbi:hypothetical protein DIPPA_31692 [Diplonema papillatum]|nr:hypothetical protein DIPPA_31692 [Diplonema papillatum]